MPSRRKERVPKFLNSFFGIISQPFVFISAYSIGFFHLFVASHLMDDSPFAAHDWDVGARIFTDRPSFEALQVEGAAYLFLTIIYFAYISGGARIKLSMKWMSVFMVALYAIVPLIFMMNSRDLISYVGWGRVLSVHSGNPYLQTPFDFVDDYRQFCWDGITLPYGIFAIPIFALAGLASKFKVAYGALVIKYIWATLMAVSAILVYRIQRLRNFEATRSFFIFAFNPYLIVEVLINGHIDILYVFFIFFSLYRLAVGKNFQSALLALFAFMTKITTGLFLSIILFFTGRRKWSLIAKVAAVLLLTLIFMRVKFFSSWEFLETFSNSRNFAEGLVFSSVKDWRWLFFLAIFFVVVHSVWRAKRIIDFDSLIDEGGKIIVFGVLALSPFQFYPWYAIITLPFAVLARSPRLKMFLLLFASSVFIYNLIDYGMVDIRGYYSLFAPKRTQWDVLMRKDTVIPIALVIFGLISVRGWMHEKRSR